MAQTKDGAIRTRDTILAKNPNHYSDIGKLGGAAGTGHAFAHGKVDPHKAGSVGGKSPRKGSKSVSKTIIKIVFTDNPTQTHKSWLKRLIGAK